MNFLRHLYMKFRLLFAAEGTMIIEAITKLMDSNPELFVLSFEYDAPTGIATCMIQAQGQISFANSCLIQAHRVRVTRNETFLDTPHELGIHLNLRDAYMLTAAVDRLVRCDKLRVI